MVFKLFHHSAVEVRPEESGAHQASDDPLNIGNILLKNNVITRSHLSAALKEQKARAAKGRCMMLGQLLIARGACTEQQLEEALEEQRRAHFPDDRRAQDAMDKLDVALGKRERSTQEMKTVTMTAMAAVKGHVH